jgi:predicted acylesterase/phospholipase RssA
MREVRLATDPPSAVVSPRYAPDDFRSPSRTCDMVMKGGITSGIVYPLAITELAREYRFVNIGGTSAGAIAAALAAAAELGRDSATGGFHRISELPEDLANGLLELFRPNRETRPAFDLLLAFLGPGGRLGKARQALGAVLRGYPLAALAGGLVGAALWAGLLALLAGRPTAGGIALLALLVLVCAILGATLRLALAAPRALERNNFGLCGGYREPRHRADASSLVDWLDGALDRTAGRTSADPLTFGDLWGEEKDAAATDPTKRRINLEMMTSNLMHGRPYRLPFETEIFHWRRGDFANLFPPRIVDWLEKHSVPATGAPQSPTPSPDDLLKLPKAADLPVVVAVRMSLSFPFLLSAVPLYAVDWGRDENKTGRLQPDYERCWFSDGGLGSNFPVHFFDALLPSRPTFGINLRPFPRGVSPQANEAKNVRFPSEPGQEVAPEWYRFTGLFGFLSALIHLMQNWVDATQTRLPGYRDRVVHVQLSEEEGGLNLEMPPERIGQLAARGRAAGRALVEQFDWDQHRWVRYRSTLPEIHHQLGRMAARFQGNGVDESFADFLKRYGAAPVHYPLARSAEALERATELLRLVENWPGTPWSKPRVPQPRPSLRIMPRI